MFKSSMSQMVKGQLSLKPDLSQELLTYTVKHVYSDHAYNEMTLITKLLGIPGKHSIYFLIDCTLTAKLDITKSRL